MAVLLLASSTAWAAETQLESRTVHHESANVGDDPTGMLESRAPPFHPSLRISLPAEIRSADPVRRRIPAGLQPRRAGVHRNPPSDFAGDIAPALEWREGLDGRIYATISVDSPAARALRIQTRVTTPTSAELRFFELHSGSASQFVHGEPIPPSPVPSPRTATLWSPTIRSESAGVEIALPDWESLAGFSFELLRVSLTPVSGGDNEVLPSLMIAPGCESHIDAQCAADPLALGKVAAVARILVEKDGQPAFCTGTLLNSRDASTDPLALGDGPVPYLLTSNSCVSSQEEAHSMEVTWFYQQDFCGADRLDHRATTTFGGGELLATSVAQDASLIRLRGDPPGGLVYSGWRASRLSVPADAHAIHHPGGGVKKTSTGSAANHEGLGELLDAIRVEWSKGAAEGGSGGAGLFVDGYLVGTLSRSDGACEAGVSHFGAFEKFYPGIKGFLLGDHGDDADNATAIGVPVSLEETLTPGDEDYFQIELASEHGVTIYTEGDTDTLATLTLDGAVVVEDDDSGSGNNFLIDSDLAAGNYILRIRGKSDSTAGSYRLRTSFDAGSAPTAAPSNVRTTRGVGRLEVSWDAVPASDNGGSPITGYTAAAANGQGHSATCATIAEDTSCVIPGLTPGLEYSVRVRAGNAFGEGPDSEAATGVPLQSEGTRILVAPTNVRTSIDHTNSSLTVHWDGIPVDSGRANVIRYTVEAVAEDASLSCQASADSSTCTLTGFEDGVTYTLTAHAESATGAGPRSESVLVTPVYSSDHGDTQTNAFDIGLNSDTAARLNPDDKDYFRLVVEQRGTLYIWTEGGINTSGRLHSDTDYITDDSNRGQGYNFRIVRVLAPGTYFLRVSGGTGQYTLSSLFIVDDHGDDRFTATVIGPDSETEGYLAHGDIDYFRLEIANRGTLTLGTTGGTDTYGRLHSNTEDITSDSNRGQGYNFRIVRVLAPGTYFLRVSGGTGQYTLSSLFIVDDHGDDRFTATVIELESETDGYLAHGDIDYFRLEIANRGTLTLETTGGTDTYGSLHSNTEDITSDSNRGQGYNFRIVRVLAPGTYFLRVSRGPGQYTLSSSFAATGDETDGSERIWTRELGEETQ